MRDGDFLPRFLPEVSKAQRVGLGTVDLGLKTAPALDTEEQLVPQTILSGDANAQA